MNEEDRTPQGVNVPEGVEYSPSSPLTLEVTREAFANMTAEPDDQLSPLDGIVWPHGGGGNPESANSSEPVDEEEAEAARVLAVATETRRLLSEPSSNIGADNRPHFLRIVEGEPESSGLCGQCGEEWPCPEFRALTPQQEHTDRTGLVQAIVSELAARGITPDTLGR